MRRRQYVLDIRNSNISCFSVRALALSTSSVKRPHALRDHRLGYNIHSVVLIARVMASIAWYSRSP